MAWDSSRPVPWQQLTRSWLIYVGVMGAVFLLFFRDRPTIGLFAGLLVSGPLYLAFGWVLAKFGYRPKLRRLDDVEYFGSEYGGWPLVTRLLNNTSQDCRPSVRICPAPTSRNARPPRR